MRSARLLRTGSAGLSLLMASALAQQAAPPGALPATPALPAPHAPVPAEESQAVAALAAELARLKEELAAQRALLRRLRADMAARDTPPAAQPVVALAAPASLLAEPGLPDVPQDWATRTAGRHEASARHALAGQGALAAGRLAALRGAGGNGAAAPDVAAADVTGQGEGAAGGAATPARAASPTGRPPEVAPLFEAPGVLTARGRTVLEPSFQFGYSSSNRVALVGYTIIPALLIGLIDVREVKRNSVTAALTARRGLTNRTEVELRVPYVYRSDATVSRELFTGTAVERVFDTSGKGLGDIELSLRHQLNDGGADRPFYVAGLRVKTRTGRDPFEVVTDCTRRCVGENATGTGLPLDLPTGSGFYGIQPNLTWLFPSDPAIFFGSVSYLHNVKRENVSRRVLNGEIEPLGEVKPGGVFGFNFGMGIALNDKASLSLGYDHSSMGRTKQNGVTVPGSVRTQLGTLLMGFSYRLSEQRAVNVTVGAGLTRDTPDVSLSVRVPLNF
ncbi:acetate kinase [Pseudoduganella buxea]|uniref:Acetate kinase n=3 Tax=Pseudoduganella buxea TaxID=1949069 RepID=A0ABQ1L845_9BURK|nr:acetate kinase [Pseudoduganella buxea]GGC20881.1 hypothetical protein GCM10011572_47930 [Pseudoduganella buxea]